MVLTARTISVGSIFPRFSRAACMNKSLTIKPENSGMPTMEREPAANPRPATLFLCAEPVRSLNFRLVFDVSVSPMAEIKSMDFVAA